MSKTKIDAHILACEEHMIECAVFFASPPLGISPHSQLLKQVRAESSTLNLQTIQGPEKPEFQAFLLGFMDTKSTVRGGIEGLALRVFKEYKLTVHRHDIHNLPRFIGLVPTAHILLLAEPESC